MLCFISDINRIDRIATGSFPLLIPYVTVRLRRVVSLSHPIGEVYARITWYICLPYPARHRCSIPSPAQVSHTQQEQVSHTQQEQVCLMTSRSRCAS